MSDIIKFENIYMVYDDIEVYLKHDNIITHIECTLNDSTSYYISLSCMEDNYPEHKNTFDKLCYLKDLYSIDFCKDIIDMYTYPFLKLDVDINIQLIMQFLSPEQIYWLQKIYYSRQLETGMYDIIPMLTIPSPDIIFVDIELEII